MTNLDITQVSMINTLIATQDNAVRQQAMVSDRPSTIASDRSLKGALWVTTTKVANMPKFSKQQRVCFVGGVGTIKNCRPESGTWTYVVEMELGPEPDMGRVGSETRLLLHEADIHPV